MVETMVPLFGPVPGGMEMVVILLIAVLLFGANKIPKLARSTGEAMGEFKKGRQEVEQELQDLQGSEEGGTQSTTESSAESSSSDDENIEYMDADSIENDESNSSN